MTAPHEPETARRPVTKEPPVSTFDPQAALKDILLPGIEAELANYFCAREAYSAIGQHAAALEKENFNVLFGHIQNDCAITALLAVAKMFDKDQQSRSIPEAVRLLSHHASALTLASAAPLRRALGSDEEDSTKLISAFVQEAQRRMQDGSFQATLDLVKSLRDKRIAHNEKKVQSANLGAPTLADLRQLTDTAIWFLDSVGEAFLSRRQSLEDPSPGQSTCLLEEDAQRFIGRAFSRLMKRANLAANP
jgi:hypothetical protein